jgi:hypothetical protein
MLFAGEEIRTERPAGLWRGALGVGVGCGALALAALLALKVRGWPISWPLFLGGTAALTLGLLGLASLLWGYGCLTVRYLLTPRGMGLRSALLWAWVPWSAVAEVGRWTGKRPRLALGPCLAWHEGKQRVVSCALQSQSLVFVRGQKATYLLSPRDQAGFLAQARFLQRLGRQMGDDQERAERRGILAHPIFGDGLGQAMMALTVALGLVLVGYVMAVYPGLPEGIYWKLTPLGEAGLPVPKKEILRIPGTAMAILGIDLALAFGSYLWERTVAHLLLMGGAMAQLLLMAGAVTAVTRA